VGCQQPFVLLEYCCYLVEAAVVVVHPQLRLVPSRHFCGAVAVENHCGVVRLNPGSVANVSCALVVKALRGIAAVMAVHQVVAASVTEIGGSHLAGAGRSCGCGSGAPGSMSVAEVVVADLESEVGHGFPAAASACNRRVHHRHPAASRGAAPRRCIHAVVVDAARGCSGVALPSAEALRLHHRSGLYPCRHSHHYCRLHNVAAAPLHVVWQGRPPRWDSQSCSMGKRNSQCLHFDPQCP